MPKTLRGFYRQASIARKCKVTFPAVSNWKSRGILPKPDLIVDEVEFWSSTTVANLIKERAATREFWGTARPGVRRYASASQRNLDIKAMFDLGMNREQIARIFGISRERVYQIGRGRH